MSAGHAILSGIFIHTKKQNMMKKKNSQGPKAFGNGPAQQSPLCDSTPR